MAFMLRSLSSKINIKLAEKSVIFPASLYQQARYSHSKIMAHGGDEYDVGHDTKKHEFFIQLKQTDGAVKPDRAILQYAFVGEREVDMYHTFVPNTFRGKGIAKILAKEAFDHAVKEDLKMRLSCTYLQKYHNDNPLPEYSKRVLE